MKIKVKFFATFKELFGGEAKEIELESGANIQDLLNLLCDSRRCRQEIFSPSGRLISYVLKNGRHIELLDGINTELKEGDVISIIPPVGGG